jgi:Na+/H+-dicarboxylate symporter
MSAQISSRKRLWVTGGSLAALTSGFALGAWAYATDNAVLLNLSATLNPIGVVWGNALRMIVVPLVVAQLVCTLVAGRGAGAVGRLTGLSFAVFSGLLALGALVTVVTMPLLLAQLEFTPDALAAMRSVSAVEQLPATGSAPGAVAWLTGLVPANVLRAASQDDLLGVMVFAIAFGIAVGRAAPERRSLIEMLFRTVADAMMTIVGWIIWLMPVAVFTLALATASRAGLGAIEVIATFVVLSCAVLFGWTLLHYPLAAIVGGVSLKRYTAALFPVQIIAVSTRSSIASLPSLIDRAQNRLALRPEVTSVVMPLAVSTFKANRSISAPIQFLFLAHVYGIDLSMVQVLTFAIASFLLSFSTIGIPSGGSLMRSAPLYVAAGIPIQGYLLAEAVESIPDIFKTLLNVTGNMTAASIVNRLSAGVEPVAAAAPAPVAGSLTGVQAQG